LSGSIEAPVHSAPPWKLYIIVFFPIGLLYKLLNKDLLGLKIDKKKYSYWSEKKVIKTSMKNQF